MVAFLFVFVIKLNHNMPVKKLGVEYYPMQISITLMSGLNDGEQRLFDSDNENGRINGNRWSLSIGRHDHNDLVLQNDTFVSRKHAKLHFEADQWWIEDCNSTNGTFTENEDQFFLDNKVTGTLPLNTSLMFRVGRTWLKIKPIE